MSIKPKWLCVFLLSAVLLGSSAPKTYSHALDISDSTWFVSVDRVVATLTIGQNLIASIEHVDVDKDSLINETELQQSLPLVKAYVAERVAVEADGKALPLLFQSVAVDDLGIVDFKLEFPSELPIRRLKIDCKLFFEESVSSHSTFANIYLPHASQVMEYNFAAATPAWEGEISAPPSVWSNMASFFVMGMEHIFTGYDHILFLIALVIIGLKLMDVLKVITSFTIAHSVTLFLAVLDIVRLNSRFVESLIAFSICYVAMENIRGEKVKYRWLISFGFGLIHGFGFASALSGLAIDKNHLILPVLSFNLGIEAGQLAIFLAILPAIYWLTKRYAYRAVTVGVSLPVFLIGFLWFIERAFNWQLLWF